MFISGAASFRDKAEARAALEYFCHFILSHTMLALKFVDNIVKPQ